MSKLDRFDFYFFVVSFIVIYISLSSFSERTVDGSCDPDWESIPTVTYPND